MKVSYYYTQNLSNIIKSHNKKLISCSNQIILPYNCRKKEECPLEGKCRANDIIYKCLTSTTGFPYKVYLGTAQGEFKKRFYNHNTSFKDESKGNDTTLAKYVWYLKLKHNVTPTLPRSIDYASKRNSKYSHTQTQMSYLIIDSNLFQSAVIFE